MSLLESQGAASQSLPQRTPSAISADKTATTREPQHATTSPAVSSADVVGDGLISFDEAETFLGEYRDQLADSFPYVIVPQGASLLDLRQQRPMLLLAILVTASWRDRTH